MVIKVCMCPAAILILSFQCLHLKTILKWKSYSNILHTQKVPFRCVYIFNFSFSTSPHKKLLSIPFFLFTLLLYVFLKPLIFISHPHLFSIQIENKLTYTFLHDNEAFRVEDLNFILCLNIHSFNDANTHGIVKKMRIIFLLQ